MRITYSSTLLCSSDPAQRHGPVSPSFNGQPIVDVVQLFRDDYATVYGRGDGPVEFTFGVWHKLASEADVIAFCATHRESLPVQADLTITDDEGTAAAVMADAVRTVRIAEVLGTSVRVDYNFTGARFTSEDVPEYDGDSDIVKALLLDLTAGDESKAFTWDTPFASAPRDVVPALRIPTGGSGFQVFLIGDVTAEGGTVGFSKPVPASPAGYKLSIGGRL